MYMYMYLLVCLCIICMQEPVVQKRVLEPLKLELYIGDCELPDMDRY